MAGHVVFIEAVTPIVDCGRYPAKAVMGVPTTVEADVFRDGHGAVGARVLYRKHGEAAFATRPMRSMGNDRFAAEIVPAENTTYLFTVEAFADPFATFAADFEKRVRAGEAATSEALEGAELLRAARAAAEDAELRTLETALRDLLSVGEDPMRALTAIRSPALVKVMSARGRRDHVRVLEPWLQLFADRPRALFSTWYELFPRSYAKTPGGHGTLREASERLPAVARMGFDVVYLPPIHPIGSAHRKGRDNTLVAMPGDPGSPWAIGNTSGGHTAIEPALGTFDDFDHFVRTARAHGMEVALDYAIQCSPDHPWVKEHPDWFFHRPDGTIKYAENPPKKYQDVYPLNFDTADRDALWHALRDIFEFWLARDVRIYRVDNPHTKPLDFWEWVIADVRGRHPDVLFLSEAFTRPKLMRALAKIGFSQSYTYFTWRNESFELRQYLEELTRTESRFFFRPNFWPNTPDILPPILQRGGRSAFLSRLVLAATLSPSYGIYSGYELCENDPLPGREEYAHSEKYEVKARDFLAPGNLNDFITTLNRARRNHVALQRLDNVQFLDTGNPSLLAYAKVTDDDALVVVVNLDPFRPHEGTVRVPKSVVAKDAYTLVDAFTGARYRWGEHNYVRLDAHLPVHLLSIDKS